MTCRSHPRELLLKIADELDRTRGDIERLGAALCDDPALTLRHVTALQALDVIAQHQGLLAAILRSDDGVRAVADATLDTLRLRLSGSAQRRCVNHPTAEPDPCGEFSSSRTITIFDRSLSN